MRKKDFGDEQPDADTTDGGDQAREHKGMVQQVLAIMENIVPYQPDIICLPEIFAYANLNGQPYQLKDAAEKVPGPVVTPFLNFARRHNCYIICPTYSLYGGHIFIAAVLIDRRNPCLGQRVRRKVDALESTANVVVDKIRQTVIGDAEGTGPDQKVASVS